jgi:hypothetical protein
MRPLYDVARAPLILSVLLAGSSAIAGAQLTNASSAATGLSGAYTARARGFNAVAWNPANLAMPGNPGFSLALFTGGLDAGLKPIDMAKLSEYSGQFVPAAVREQWMVDVTSAGGQKGAAGGGVTWLALNLGKIGFQLDTKVASDANLAPDAMEAILFGNAGRTGTVKSLNLAGSSLQGAAYSTGAFALGLPLGGLVPLTDFAAGMTVKYTVGHALVMALDDGSSIGTNDVRVNFPAVTLDSLSREEAKSGTPIGTGIGLDLGAAWTIPKMRFGVSLQNVFNSFKWDSTKLATTTVTSYFASDTSYSKNEEDQPYATAPAALRAKVAAQKFKPVFAAGMSFDWLPKITLSGDYRQQVGDGIEVGPKSTIAGGVEFRWIPFIPLRGGVSLMDGGVGFSGGVGIRLLGFETGLAGFVRKRDDGTESGVTFSAISIRP